MKSELSIDVSASPARVFELARDLSAWPTRLPHYRRVTIESRNGQKVIATMVAVRRFGPLPVPVSWRAEQWSDDSDPDDLRLHFRHVRGFTRGMDVIWHIRPAGATADAASVTIEHDFSRPLPLIGTEVVPAFVDRVFVRPIASRTLATFKRLAEQRA